MVIDLIIPTYKPGDKFQESLKRLALQTRKPDRIILVNTEAEFFDEEILKKKNLIMGKQEIMEHRLPKKLTF